MKKSIFCCTNCNFQTDLTFTDPRCPKCNEPLAVLSPIDHENIDIKSWDKPFWERYSNFYPYISNSAPLLGAGLTPLTSLSDLADQYDLAALFVKNETMNPTWSFKDRGTAVGVNHALSLGYQRIGTVSTGNMAASVAAYGTKAGLDTYILVKGDMADEKMNPIAIYGVNLIRVHGDYGQLYNKSLELGAANNIYFINSDVPMRIEGSKSIAFEIAEQMAFDVPDYVIVPTSAGGNFRGIMKGFVEFYEAGLTSKIPTPICAQSTGCYPIVKAFLAGHEKISHFGPTDTIAHGIENPIPPSGNAVLRILKKYNGLAVAVNNQEILAAQRVMATNGIFGQPASAVPLAAVHKLHQQQQLPKGSKVALIATGSGLKYTAAFAKHKLHSSETTVAELPQHFQELIK